MNKKLLALVVLLMSAASLTARASDIRLGEPAYGGTGCPSGSASVTLSPDQKTLSILFDQFVAEAGGSTMQTLDRKSCNIAIPVSVPQGYSISLFAVDYRGYTFIPMGGTGRFTAEYFFAGQRGPMYLKDFRGPIDNEYLISNQIMASAMVWSACGAQTTLRVNSSMMVRTNRSQQQTLATVDSADIKSGLVYHIQWRQCY